MITDEMCFNGSRKEKREILLRNRMHSDRWKLQTTFVIGFTLDEKRPENSYSGDCGHRY